MPGGALRGLLLLGLLVAAGAGLRSLRAEDPPTTGPDYGFYKQFVAPIVAERCAECHANPRKRLGKHVLKPAPGRTLRESHQRDNFSTLLGLVEPGNPSQSLWLLKALGPDQGGVTHGGGARIRIGSAEYGAMVDWIQGKKVEARAFAPPPTPEGEPDFAFFVVRIAPTLAQVCAECHAGKGQGKLALRTAARGAELALEEQYANYRTVLGLVDRKRPERSRFLTKPLAVADGGVPHKGGDRIRKDDANHVNWLAFLRGERGPSLPGSPGRETTGPLLLEATLRIEGERMTREGEVLEAADPVKAEQRWVQAGAYGGRVRVTLQVPEAGDYALALEAVGGEGPLGLALDGRPLATVDVPLFDGERGTLAPAFLLDGAAALRTPRGSLLPADGGLALAGRGGEASFLSAGEVDHRAGEAEVLLPPEDEGGDDAWLLFDMRDADNGKLLGLVDGGRRMVMGLLEGGVPRILSSAKAFRASEEGAARRLRVDFIEGVAVGRLDLQPLVFLRLDQQLGQGSFGLATHGRVLLRRLAAIDQFPVHTVAFGWGPILRLPAGVHVLELELPPGGAGLDALTLTLAGE
ncbi:MAG: hypothetical protein ACKOSS_02435 [Planctomycetia bacterium]